LRSSPRRAAFPAGQIAAVLDYLQPMQSLDGLIFQEGDLTLTLLLLAAGGGGVVLGVAATDRTRSSIRLVARRRCEDACPTGNCYESRNRKRPAAWTQALQPVQLGRSLLSEDDKPDEFMGSSRGRELLTRLRCPLPQRERSAAK
jgi:hypothetical protein